MFTRPQRGGEGREERERGREGEKERKRAEIAVVTARGLRHITFKLFYYPESHCTYSPYHNLKPQRQCHLNSINIHNTLNYRENSIWQMVQEWLREQEQDHTCPVRPKQTQHQMSKTHRKYHWWFISVRQLSVSIHVAHLVYSAAVCVCVCL